LRENARVPARTVVRGGTVVNASGERTADVVIEGSRVSELAEPGTVSGEREIDASGCLVLPGAIDPHVHFETDIGIVTVDGFTSGTASAACGGTTTSLHFAFQAVDESPLECLDRWHERLRAAAPAGDVGFHLLVTSIRSDADLAELRELPARGVTTVKVFMASFPMLDGRTLFRVMRATADCGALLMVHCEDGEAIDVLIDEALAAGRTDVRWHPRTRPPETEASAIARAAQLTHLAGCPLYVVHVSSAAGAAEVAHAREAGMAVAGETCPQYLLADESAYEQPPEEALKYLFTPPARHVSNQEPLWQALASGALSTVGSDHAPFMHADKLGHADFTQVPQGAAGIETRLPLVYHHGVVSGRFSRVRMVEVLAEAPARIFGLYPRKGVLQPGSDGDVVVFDPSARTTVSASRLHSRSDYTIFEGMEIEGAVRDVLVRGHSVVRDGELVPDPPPGVFLERGQPVMSR
jgi:dihydropyrimidinase